MNWKLILPLAIVTTTSVAQTNFVATTPSSNTPGADNTLVGVGAGNLNMSGSGNLFIGRGTGTVNMAGTQNVFLGALSGNQNSSGQNNSFVGYGAGYNNGTGNNNSFLGSGAGFTNINGYNNVFNGYRSGYFNQSGFNNVFLGAGSGYGNINGSDNTFLGADAGSVNSSGVNNVFVGSLSGSSNQSGQSNVFVGVKSGQSSTNSTNNVFIGTLSGFSNTTASNNTFVGYSSGYNTTSGVANVFIGSQAGFSNTGGGGNMFLGQQAGFSNTSGSFNLFMGNSSGQYSTGAGNTFIGDGAGLRNVGGTGNIAIGQYAGSLNFGGNIATNPINGSYNTFIGWNSGLPAGNSTITKSVAIGYQAVVSQNNAIALGGTGADAVSVGIGTSSPTNTLHIVSTTANASGLRLQNLTSSSPASVTGSTKFLSVDASGNVILASLNASPRLATSTDAVPTAESYWQLAGGRLSNSSGEAVVIGKGISKLGGNYGLYVEKGILTEKVKVAVKNTSEWSDYVFAPAYKLRKLEEVEAFIQSHGHLPGVPSAEQVVADGIDMAKMDATLLQKIEELTLYILKQQRQIEQLQNQNEVILKQLSKSKK